MVRSIRLPSYSLGVMILGFGMGNRKDPTRQPCTPASQKLGNIPLFLTSSNNLYSSALYSFPLRLPSFTHISGAFVPVTECVTRGLSI